ncbi:D-2-hydroxyacid dehydrogenase [Roseomonas sp. KE2513]|uniref:D-2-hydroxyacid dehydrogenase n=1 Tax=Roseomonas sp. KE2513 TaxID=2479202 RepID=UPI0018E03D9E|nr:D-2-hydroxyacid dehydrogenase [Roseomonas sp. KE2513]MBI0535761.1 D-2-hydroxyacid dehydrogenase [Roseomonas sp. KE2513]
MAVSDILFFGKDAEYYREHLAQEFPGLRLHLAKDNAGITGQAAESQLLVAMAPAVTAATVRALPRLQWVQAMTTGVDNLLIMPELPPEVAITRVRGIHGPQMSEMAILNMMLLARNFPAVLRNQERRRWERWPQKLLVGRTAVILGVGSISEELAPRCKAFGMRVIGISSRSEPPPGFDKMMPRARLAEAAALADFLILLTPYTPETHNIIDAKLLASMRPDSWLVNLARGNVVDEEALATALRAGTIAGAALDVFAQEPLPESSPLWDTPNLIITPHIGGMSDTYAEQALPTLRQNLADFLRGGVGALQEQIERPARAGAT